MGDWRSFVEVSDAPILVGDHPNVRHTRGHLLTIGGPADPTGRWPATSLRR
jgi:hypothetical protein